MPHIVLGLTIYFASVVPVGSFLLRKFVGGMYSPMFKESPHYVYLSLKPSSNLSYTTDYNFTFHQVL